MKHKDLENPEYLAWLRFLRDSEKWDAERIHDHELSEIRRVTLHAYQSTAGYRELFDRQGIHPVEIKSLSDFERVPFTDKALFQNRLEDLSIPAPDRFYVTTGGSSGIPMGMYRDHTAFSRELASKAHQYHRIGWREGDRQMVFRGLPIETSDFTEFVPEFNELRCSTYQFTPEKLELYRRKAGDYNPDWIRCYPSAGYLFASFLLEKDREFPKVKGVLCASEMLYDHQKHAMEKAFGGRVFSHYGHYELAALAGFCEYTDDYHVLPQYGYVELIGKDGKPVTRPGEVGEIVATSFIMNITPFIRYRTGDLAVFKSLGCEKCGRPYRIWEKVVGRRQEMIVSATGRLVSMTMLNMHDSIYDDLRQYQFYQRERGKLVLRCVPKSGLSPESAETIKRKLFVKLGPDFSLEVQPMESIELTPRGKHKVLVQELDFSGTQLSLD